MSSNYYHSVRNQDANASGSFSNVNNNNAGLQEMNSSSSLNGRSLTYNPLGEIQHTSLLCEQISALHLSDNCSDLVLIVEGQRLPAHRMLLAARSAYFCAMLYGGMRESSENEVTLIDTPLEAFKVLLKYIYTGRMQLKSLDFNLVLDILGLVHKYGFSELETAIPEYLKSVIKNRNVCAIFTSAHHYSITPLISACLDFIDSCASEIVETSAFIELPAQALIKILKRNSFCCPELDIFAMIKRWIEAHPDDSDYFDAILKQLRLPLIPLKDLFGPIRESGLVSPDQILDAIKDQNILRTSQLNYRGFLLPGTNIATPLFGAKVIEGDYRTALLTNQNTDEECASSTDRTYAKHLINPRDSSGITIELGKPFIINNIRLHLMDRDQRAYSYYIETSMDRQDWIRVIDHTNYLCRSRQNLFFEERVMKFIRIVGTHSTVNNTFQLGSFEALFATDQFEIDYQTTLQIPKSNVATTTNNAVVIEGVSRSKNALLNGDTCNYDWDNGYTCHQIGSGALVIQLPQPYLTDTMRLLLWDCDHRCYSFYVEVSADQNKWTKVAELSECRSWQFICFNRIPIVFIRIVGTYNSANEVFHCVHFECPAMEINATAEKERLLRVHRVTMEMAPSVEGAGENIVAREERAQQQPQEGELIRRKSADEEMQEEESPQEEEDISDSELAEESREKSGEINGFLTTTKTNHEGIGRSGSAQPSTSASCSKQNRNSLPPN